MQARDLKFKGLIKADEASGILSLGDNRVVIIGADAFGHIRKELVDNLGVDAAKGILIRYGYRCGHSDAVRLKDRHPWRSELEWLLAGPKLHAIEGVVKVECEELKIDRQNGDFFMRGQWKNSFEAEQHIKLFGRSESPVCWSLSGYASGYASTFFGKAVYADETECIGRGDAVCRFELRTFQTSDEKAKQYQQYLERVHFKLLFDDCLECVGSLSSQLVEMTEPRGYLESILKHSPEAIITTDENGVISFYSQGAEQLCGYSAEEVIGKHASFLYAGNLNDSDMMVDALKQKGRIQSYETEFLGRTGNIIPVHASISLIKDRQGKVMGLLHIVQDLREVRRSVRELEQSDAFLAHSLFDSADAIIAVDMNNIITSWSKGAEVTYGYSEREVLGQPLEFFVPPDLKEGKELEKIDEYLRKDGIVRNFQTERLTKDGRRITVLLTRAMIKNEKGEMVGSSIIAKDITKIKGMERQLMRAEHFTILGELAASLAHEIKNPLGGIKGAVEVIRDELCNTDPHKAILQDVLYEVNRIDKAVRDLLSYAKPRGPDFGEVELEAVLKRVISLTQKPLKEKNISIELSVGSHLSHIWADANQMEQLFMNLVLNSLQAIDRAGTVSIKAVEYTGQGFEIVIKDTGRGIPTEIKDKVFQPFFTTKTEGSGLGLAICQHIVMNHGGFIDLKSTPGTGTAVRIWLPSMPEGRAANEA
ncbi:MAG: PAS domain S-box protein [Acidobacteria bacterium]|nr:PAS domain S-box protein [Acidobacteriota bacterium]MBI3656669.1 PAS domain S-box protein [Acidobacteriota bacterium]